MVNFAIYSCIIWKTTIWNSRRTHAHTSNTHTNTHTNTHSVCTWHFQKTLFWARPERTSLPHTPRPSLPLISGARPRVSPISSPPAGYDSHESIEVMTLIPVRSMSLSLIPLLYVQTQTQPLRKWLVKSNAVKFLLKARLHQQMRQDSSINFLNRLYRD